MRTHRTLRRAAIAAVALVAIALGSAAMVSAQSDGVLVIRRVDATDPKNVKVDFIWTGPQGELSGLKLTQNDVELTPAPAPAPNKTPQRIALVFDSGPEMDRGNALVTAREAAIKLVNASPEVEFLVVQAGDKPDLKLELTTDTKKIVNAIETIGPTKGSSIWGALTIAGTTLKDGKDLQPNILLMVGTDDTVSPQNQAVGRTAVLSSGASMFVVERLGAMDPGPYDSLTARAGGQVVGSSDGAKQGDLVTQAGTAIKTQQYQMAYPANLGTQQIADLKVTVGGFSSTASFLPGGVYAGGEALRPEIGSRGSTLPLLDNTAVLFLALLMALVATAGAAYALTTTFIRDDLSDVLQPYSDSYGQDESDGASTIGKTALMKRAAALTEQVAESQGFLTRAEGALERANMPLRAGEAMSFYLVIVIVVTILALFWTKNLVGGLLLGGLAAWVPIVYVSRRAKKRRKKFLSQLPDTLSLLSGTLKAGYSLMQGVEAVSQEVEEPMGLELRRVVTEARLGRPLEDSLEASALRMDSPDFAWAVMAIGIQREVGGNLSELLMTVADTMVQRERLRRDVQSLTAEGRVSAVVLGGLPLGLGMIMYALNPDYMGVLFSDSLGVGMLIVAAISMLIGFLWMKKIITIEI